MSRSVVSSARIEVSLDAAGVQAEGLVGGRDLEVVGHLLVKNIHPLLSRGHQSMKPGATDVGSWAGGTRKECAWRALPKRTSANGEGCSGKRGSMRLLPPGIQKISDGGPSG